MNIHEYPRSYACLIFLMLFFLQSCSGQDQSKQTPLHVQSDSHLDSTKVKDSFFYIDGQLSQHVRAIFEDSRGHLWFGTTVYGVMRYDGDSLIYFNRKTGVDFGGVYDITEDKNGTVWMATGVGVASYDGKHFTTYDQSNGLPENQCWAILQDRLDRLWVGTTQGLYYLEGDNFIKKKLAPSGISNPNYVLWEERVSALMEDKNGHLWVGTDGHGVYVLDKEHNHLNHFSTAHGLPDNVISDIFQDSTHDIWIGTMLGGLSYYDGNSFINLNQDSIVSGVEVGRLHEDSEHNLWIPIEHVGLYKYKIGTPMDKSSFELFDQTDGINSSGIICTLQDSKGLFWIGGWGGLFRQINELSNGEPFINVTLNGPWK